MIFMGHVFLHTRSHDRSWAVIKVITHVPKPFLELTQRHGTP